MLKALSAVENYKQGCSSFPIWNRWNSREFGLKYNYAKNITQSTKTKQKRQEIKLKFINNLNFAPIVFLTVLI